MSKDAGIFLLGCGRSGTTLLRAMMDAHSQLGMSHESRFISFMTRNRERYEQHGFRSDRFLNDLYELPLSRSRFFVLGLSRTDVEAEVAAREPKDLGEALDCVFGLYARTRGKQRWGDKTPGLLPYATELAEVVPNALFIHLVRDGRDVAAAYRDAPFGSGSLLDAGLHWERHVGFAQELRAILPRHRFLELRYEDLVQDPRAALSAVCEFCGLSFEPTMLSYFDHSADGARGYVGQSHHQSVAQPVDPTLRDWRRDLPSEEVAMLEFLLGPTLRAYGYEAADDTRTRLGPSLRRSLYLRRRVDTLKNPLRMARRRAGDRFATSPLYRSLKGTPAVRNS